MHDTTTQATQSAPAHDDAKASFTVSRRADELQFRASPPKVTIFNDLQSNVTFSALGSIGSAGLGQRPGQSVYFEGTNIIVYIRGTEDDEIEWWKADDLNSNKSFKKGGVLVNAHYDRYGITISRSLRCSSIRGWLDKFYKYSSLIRQWRFSQECFLLLHVFMPLWPST
jgi:hypothetical protein